jgi:hypothetical protein
MYEDTTTNSPCVVKIEVSGVKNVMILSETVFLRRASSKMDRFPAYMDHSLVK